MRRRVLTTTKILALALATMPACTKPEAKAEPTMPSAGASVSSAPLNPPPLPGVEDPKLLAMRDDLAGMKREEGLASAARFRPLCDKDGYPLVGNLTRKVADPGLMPSELCAEVRKKPGH